MFTGYHIAWIAVCAALIIAAIQFLVRRKPSLQTVLSVLCVVCILSELTKTFSVAEMVPSMDGSRMHVYLPMQHLPLHLCSLQILLIFYTRFTQNAKMRETVLAFMYPTCLIGAFLALMIPTIFSSSISLQQAFTHPLAYQYFLYHAALVVLGLYIPLSGQVDLRPRHYLTTMAGLGLAAFVSIYLNSMFASPTYVNDKLVSVDYAPNFFFTYRTPIGIELTALWQWYVYLIVLIVLAALLLALCYLPYFIRAHREKR